MKQRDIILVLSAVLLSTMANLLLTSMPKHSEEVSEPAAKYVNNQTMREIIVSGGTQPVSFVKAAYIGTRAVVRVNAMSSGGNVWGRSGTNGASQGSGVIISPDGYIATNHHVIANTQNFSVEMSDRKVFPATLVGSDPSTDIAVLKINKTDMPYITMGNSDSVMVGEWVIAVGNPYHLSSTVTAGIVSSKGRVIDLLKGAFTLESFIQTDAVVNSGNSGGALVNEAGRLIGLNTAIFTESGRFEGYSFAIPSNIVKKVTKDIIDYGKVQRANLGVSIENLNDDLATKLGLEPDQGVHISLVFSGSAAGAAGLVAGDVVTAINNIPVTTYPQLQEQIALFRPGETVKVSFIRNKKLRHLSVKLSGSSTESTSSIRADKPLIDLGFELRDLSPSEKKDRQSGAIVHSVLKGSKASQALIESGFVIHAVNGQRINNTNDFIQKLANYSEYILLEGSYKKEDGIVTYRLDDVMEGI